MIRQRRALSAVGVLGAIAAVAAAVYFATRNGGGRRGTVRKPAKVCSDN